MIETVGGKSQSHAHSSGSASRLHSRTGSAREALAGRAQSNSSGRDRRQCRSWDGKSAAACRRQVARRAALATASVAPRALPSRRPCRAAESAMWPSNLGQPSEARLRLGPLSTHRCGSVSVREQISRHLCLVMCVFASQVSMQSLRVFPRAPSTGRPPLLAALAGVRELSVDSGKVVPVPVLFGANCPLFPVCPGLVVSVPGGCRDV